MCPKPHRLNAFHPRPTVDVDPDTMTVAAFIYIPECLHERTIFFPISVRWVIVTTNEDMNSEQTRIYVFNFSNPRANQKNKVKTKRNGPTNSYQEKRLLCSQELEEQQLRKDVIKAIADYRC